MIKVASFSVKEFSVSESFIQDYSSFYILPSLFHSCENKYMLMPVFGVTDDCDIKYQNIDTSVCQKECAW